MSAPTLAPPVSDAPVTARRPKSRFAGLLGPLGAKKRAAKTADVQRAQCPSSVAWAAWDSARRVKWGARVGMYEPAPLGALTSTRQMEVSNLAVSSVPTDYRGLVVGMDEDSGQIIVHDPFFSYPRLIRDPNVCVVGDVGGSKSSLLKTWGVWRPLLVGRDIVVVDKKPQGSNATEGEYAELSRMLGREPITFRIGSGGTCLNILDDRLAPYLDIDPFASNAAAQENSAEANKRPENQNRLVRAVIETIMGRTLDAFEGKALRVAHRRARLDARQANTVPVLRDLMTRLIHPAEEDAAAVEVSVKKMRTWGLAMAFEVERLISDDLAGLFDGPTSKNVQLGSGLTVFDVSQLPEFGPALPLVMVVINTWLTNHLFAQRSAEKQTHFIVEEAWHLVVGSIAEVIRRNLKVSRGIGLANFFAFHHVSDIPAGSPAEAILKECSTVAIYQQKRSQDAETAVQFFDLAPGSEFAIKNLEPGSCLFKIGKHPAISLRHMRSSVEVMLTDTDSAMTVSEQTNQTEEEQ